MRVVEKICSQSSNNSSNKNKKNFSLNPNIIINNKNNNIIKIRKIINKKLNIININQKRNNRNIYNYDEEHYSFIDRKRSNNEKG